MRHARITMKKRKAECYGNLVVFRLNMGRVYKKWQSVWFHKAGSESWATRYKNLWENDEDFKLTMLRGGR